MMIPPAEYSNGAPYWGEAYGSGSGVPDGEAGNRIRQHLPRGITMEDLEYFWHVDVAPEGVYVATAEFVSHVTAGGASGGGLIQPLLFSGPVGASGTINGAPQSSRDGVAGHYWPLTVTDAFPTGDGGTPDFGLGALAVTDAFPWGDEGTPGVNARYQHHWRSSAGNSGRASPSGVCIFLLSVFNLAHILQHFGLGWAGRSPVRHTLSSATDQHVIDMTLAPPAADRAEGESTDATTGTTDRARKYLEKLLFNFLPACVFALGPLSGASDKVKLATFIILAVLIVLLVIGMSSRACAKHVVRLSTCAGIFAMTVFVSAQFSRGIYVAIAALVGVALSGITLAA